MIPLSLFASSGLGGTIFGFGIIECSEGILACTSIYSGTPSPVEPKLVLSLLADLSPSTLSTIALKALVSLK